MSQYAQQIQQAMQQGQFHTALGLSENWYYQTKDSTALYWQACNLRYTQQLPQAYQVIIAHLAKQPKHARGLQELGHIERAQQRFTSALRAYQQAVQINPSLLACWQGIQQIAQTQAGSVDRSLLLACEQQLAYFMSLPKAVKGAFSLYYDGKLQKAENTIRPWLQQHPHDVPALRLLALIAKDLKILDDAETLMRKAHELQPQSLPIALELVDILHLRQHYPAALALATTTLAQYPQAPEAILSYAYQCAAVDDYDQAITYFQQAQTFYPHNPGIPLQLGHIYKNRTDFQQAAAYYQQAYQCQRDFGDAYWSLANLKRYRFSNEELATMQDLLSQDILTSDDAVHIHFALAKALEDKQDYAQAFYHYQTGNERKAQTLNYQAEQISQRVKQQIEIIQPSWYVDQTSGYQAADPIFIVGLPRAGSTLLEQILASHSQIDATAELPNILALARQLDGRLKTDKPYFYRLTDYSDAECQQMGQDYIEQTRHLRGEAPYFIDKMPNNFLHLGLIKRILPNAKFIDARREPVSCCFSAYKQLFAQGQEFSYDLNTTAQYYQDYLRLMDHWQKCFGANILTVQHEDVVDDLAAQVTRMLNFLDVPFESACLRYYETKRNIKTPSAAQVTQPPNKAAQQQWRPFKPYLSALLDRFGEPD